MKTIFIIFCVYSLFVLKPSIYYRVFSVERRTQTVETLHAVCTLQRDSTNLLLYATLHYSATLPIFCSTQSCYSDILSRALPCALQTVYTANKCFSTREQHGRATWSLTFYFILIYFLNVQSSVRRKVIQSKSSLAPSLVSPPNQYHEQNFLSKDKLYIFYCRWPIFPLFTVFHSSYI